MDTVLDCARDRFAAYGFSHVSMQQIADDLGIGRVTLHRYVGTRDELAAMVIRREGVLLVNALVDQLGTRIADPSALVGRLVSGSVNEINARPVLLQAIGVDLPMVLATFTTQAVLLVAELLPAISAGLVDRIEGLRKGRIVDEIAEDLIRYVLSIMTSPTMGSSLLHDPNRAGHRAARLFGPALAALAAR
jgi:AcrR family transcriptional regulator